jgi:FtsZ-binding cell division protein ZapB
MLNGNEERIQSAIDTILLTRDMLKERNLI